MKLMVLAGPILAFFAWSTGFVLERLWAWHAVPLGAPSLGWKTFAVAYLGVAVFRLTSRTPRKEWRDAREQIEAFALFLLWPWFALAIGWFWR
jgi:uncharacterized membrane protein